MGFVSKSTMFGIQGLATQGMCELTKYTTTVTFELSAFYLSGGRSFYSSQEGFR